MHSALDLVTSLLKQLCLLSHIVPRRLKEVYDRSEDQAHLQLVLDDMLEAFKETSQDIHQPITIVVDGLDEVNMDGQKDMVKVLTSLKETSCNCLFTSRFDQGILLGALEGCSEFSIQNSHLVDDIRNFVDGALRGDKAVHEMLRDESLRSDVVFTLSSCANGM